MTAPQRAGVVGGVSAVVLLALPLVASWEGLSRDPYKDLIGTGKPMTVCYGQTNVEMRRYTKAECDAMLVKSLTKHVEPVLACLPPDAPLEVKAAFGSFAYNVGVSAACGSRAAKYARAGNYRAACEGLTRWVMAGGKVRQGLRNRRHAERALCLKGVS